MADNVGNDPGGQGHGGPQGGQPPPGGPSQQPPQGGGGWGPQDGDPDDKRRTALIVAGVIALLLGVGAGGYLALSGGGDAGETAAGEIFLEPAAAVGPDPFAEDPFAEGAEDRFSGQDGEPSGDGGGAVTTTSGGKPGLYGGTNDKTKCDTEQLKAFLTDPANNNKAQAWVTALNADPKLNWPGGQLTVADIPAYLDSLTPLVLTSDMRVTNHGYEGDGKPTVIRQSVLQAGMAVLVDPYGVTRVKCFCGNPLIGPQPQPQGTTYTNDPWPGFDPNKVVVVSPPPEPLTEIQIRDPNDPSTLISHPLPPPGGPSTPPAPVVTPTSPPPTVTPPAPVVTPPAPVVTPSPVVTPTGPPPRTDEAPDLSSPAATRMPGNDATHCSAGGFFYELSATYFDGDGDALGGKVFVNQGPEEPSATITGDGTNGQMVVGVCAGAESGETFQLSMEDAGGNRSLPVEVTT